MYDSIQLNDYLDILICLPSSKIYLLIKTRSIRVILLAILLGKKIFFPFLHIYCWLRCKGPPPLLVNLNNVVTAAAAVSPLSRHLCCAGPQIVAVIAQEEECRFMIGRGDEYGHLNAIFIICTLVNMNN